MHLPSYLGTVSTFILHDRSVRIEFLATSRISISGSEAINHRHADSHQICLIVGAAARSHSILQVFEDVPTPEGWIEAGRPHPQTRIRLRIAMRMPDHDLLEKTLYKISTQDHQDYGKHLNHEEVRVSARNICFIGWHLANVI